MLVLASGSPRRRELLRTAGYEFTVDVPDTDETPLPGEDAVALAVRLAKAKAAAVSAAKPSAVVLAADTVVAAPSGELLGKPLDDRDAARMLHLLSGAVHQVVTGVCVIDVGRVEVAASLTSVRMRTLGAAEIEAYVRSGEPHGKAGAYAIQGGAARWIPWVQGEYANVVGLPIALVSEILSGFSIFPRN